MNHLQNWVELMNEPEFGGATIGSSSLKDMARKQKIKENDAAIALQMFFNLPSYYLAPSI